MPPTHAHRPFRRLVAVAGLALALGGCTAGLDFEAGPDETDLAGDTSPPDTIATDTGAPDTAAPCADVATPCAAPAASCSGDVLVTCADRGDGCLELTSTSCADGAGGFCDDTGAAPVCASDPCFGLTLCAAEGASCDADTLVRCEPNVDGCLVETRTACTTVVTDGVCNPLADPPICAAPLCANVVDGCATEGTACSSDGTTVLACEPDPAQNDCLVQRVVEDCAARAPGGSCAGAPPACIDPCPDCPALEFITSSTDLHTDDAATIVALAADEAGVLALGQTASGFLLHCLSANTLGRTREPLDIAAAGGFIPAGEPTLVLLGDFAVVPGTPALVVERATCSLVPSTIGAHAFDTVAPVAGPGTRFFAVRTNGQNLIESFDIVPEGAPPADIAACLGQGPAPCVRRLCDDTTCGPTPTIPGTLRLDALPPSGTGESQELVVSVRSGTSTFWSSHRIDLSGAVPALADELEAEPAMFIERFLPVAPRAVALRAVETTLVELDRGTNTLTSHPVPEPLLDAGPVDDGTGMTSALGLLESGELRGLRWTPLEASPVALHPLQLDGVVGGTIERFVTVGDRVFVVAGDRVVELMASRRSL